MVCGDYAPFEVVDVDVFEEWGVELILDAFACGGDDGFEEDGDYCYYLSEVS